VIIIHQTNVSAFAGGHTYWFFPGLMFPSRVAVASIENFATLTIASSGWG